MEINPAKIVLDIYGVQSTHKLDNPIKKQKK